MLKYYFYMSTLGKVLKYGLYTAKVKMYKILKH